MFTIFLLNTKKLHNHFYSLHKWFFEKRDKIPGNTWKNSAKRDWRKEKIKVKNCVLRFCFYCYGQLLLEKEITEYWGALFLLMGVRLSNCFATQYFQERIFNWSLLSESIHNCLLFQTKVILIVLWLPAQQVFYSQGTQPYSLKLCVNLNSICHHYMPLSFSVKIDITVSFCVP